MSEDSPLPNAPVLGEFQEIPAWLYRRPAGASEPPVVTQLLALDFLKISWEAFEQLALEVAEQVDGLKNPSLYGKRGQRQDSIDFYGDLPFGRACYQVRGLDVEPSPTHLRVAVEDFRRRGKKFSARRFVLCIARSGRSVKVQDELIKLKAENPSLEIELYDSDLLSGILKQRRDIVHRFFGPAWAEALCGPLPSPAAIADQLPDRIDALLRGPLAALGLEHRLQEAEATADPALAARIYADLATEVAEQFAPLVPQMRLREADAWLRAGDVAVAAKVWLELAVRFVDTSPLITDLASSRLRDHAASLSDQDRLVNAALDAKLSWYRGDGTAVERLGPMLDELMAASSSWAPTVALWLGELALVDNAFDRIAEKAATIAQLANRVKSSAEDLNIRLELVLAEQSGDWASLLSLAVTGRVAPHNCGLILVRRGRWLADRGQPDDAVDSFLQAVTPLARTKWLGDAAEALYSIVDVLFEYGPMEQADRYRERANLVRGQPKRLAADRDYEAAALDNMHHDHYGEAHLLLRRLTWQSVIAGHTTDESRARGLLADVYARAGEGSAAIGNYLLAGRGNEAEAVIKAAAVYVPVPLAEEPMRPSRLAAQLSALEVEADLMPESVARSLFPRLVALVPGIRQGHFAPTVGERSIRVLGAIALQLSEGQVAQLLEIVTPLIPREPNTFRRVDEAILQILSVAWRRHPPLRIRAAALLPQVLCESHIGQQSLSLLPELVKEDPQIAAAVVGSAAARCLEATLVLALADVDHPTVAADARRRYEGLMARAPREVSDPVMGIGANFELAAAFVRWLTPRQRAQLARHLIGFAQSTNEPEINRASAIAAIGLMAEHLGRDLQREMFDRALALASRDAVPSDFDSLAGQSQHLLSMFRLNLPERVLPHSALSAAGRLCRSRNHARELHPLLLQWLTSNDPREIRSAIASYLLLPAALKPRLDVHPWAEHPAGTVRSAAVAVWLEEPLRASDLAERFARDTDRSVRHQLALLMQLLVQRAPALAARITPILAADISAEIRALATPAV